MHLVAWTITQYIYLYQYHDNTNIIRQLYNYTPPRLCGLLVDTNLQFYPTYVTLYIHWLHIFPFTRDTILYTCACMFSCNDVVGF